jgi:hypothetical protein
MKSNFPVSVCSDIGRAGLLASRLASLLASSPLRLGALRAHGIHRADSLSTRPLRSTAAAEREL